MAPPSAPISIPAMTDSRRIGVNKAFTTKDTKITKFGDWVFLTLRVLGDEKNQFNDARDRHRSVNSIIASARAMIYLPFV
jgi:hypothetical protein